MRLFILDSQLSCVQCPVFVMLMVTFLNFEMVWTDNFLSINSSYDLKFNMIALFPFYYLLFVERGGEGGKEKEQIILLVKKRFLGWRNFLYIRKKKCGPAPLVSSSGYPTLILKLG